MDMQPFLDTFFEESAEGLDQMEQALLSLEPGVTPPRESLDAIFRAAHSIKGGSGTFGLPAVAGYTHDVETLLDRLREGELTLDAECLEALLESVDVTRRLLDALRAGETPDTGPVAASSARLRALLGSPPGGESEGSADSDAGGAATQNAWRVRFSPQPQLFTTGNDPARLIRDLEALGRVHAECDTAALPAWTDLDPEACHLAWLLTVRGGSEADIREILEWVEDDARIEVAPLAPAPQDAAAAVTDGGPRGSGEDGDTASARPGRGAGSSVRVQTEKIDALIDLVGELVITQSMLLDTARSCDEVTGRRLRDGLTQLERNTRELQEGVMRIRMVPIQFAYARLPRLVHDTAGQLGKQVHLDLSGEQTEVDKTVSERLTDPLVHLLRNAVDHGIEPPEARRAAGKPEAGTIRVAAEHRGGHVVIEVTDDGRGLERDRILARARAQGLPGAERDDLDDSAVFDFVFEPGFSTAEQATEVSGRGVGMDVVRRNIRELGGSLQVASQPGEGSRVTISLPLTLTIVDGQLLRVGEEVYVVPLPAVLESLQVKPEELRDVAGQGCVCAWRDGYVPVVGLDRLFGLERRRDEHGRTLMMVLESEEARVGILVDELLEQQQVVVKSLEANYAPVPGSMGATILGDGRVALILDVAGLLALSRECPAMPLAAG